MAEMLRSSGVPEAQWAERVQALQAAMVPERGVSKSAELERILSLPRRLWESNAELLAEKVTMYLRAPGGVQKLRPVQAATLKDAHDQGGAFCPQRVSAGKTLSSLLGFTGARESLRETMSPRDGRGEVPLLASPPELSAEMKSGA